MQINLAACAMGYGHLSIRRNMAAVQPCCVPATAPPANSRPLRLDPRASGFHSFGETCAIKPGAKPIIGMTAISLSIEIKPNAAPDLGLTIIESPSDE